MNNKRLLKEYINQKGGIIKIFKDECIYKTYYIQAGSFNSFNEFQIDWNLTITKVNLEFIYDSIIDAKTFLMRINKWDYMNYDNCEIIIPR